MIPLQMLENPNDWILSWYLGEAKEAIIIRSIIFKKNIITRPSLGSGFLLEISSGDFFKSKPPSIPLSFLGGGGGSWLTFN